MTSQRGPTPAPFFSLADGAWIPYALTRDIETGEFRGVEGPRGFATYREAVVLSPTLLCRFSSEGSARRGQRERPHREDSIDAVDDGNQTLTHIIAPKGGLRMAVPAAGVATTIVVGFATMLTEVGAVYLMRAFFKEQMNDAIDALVKSLVEKTRQVVRAEVTEREIERVRGDLSGILRSIDDLKDSKSHTFKRDTLAQVLIDAHKLESYLDVGLGLRAFELWQVACDIELGLEQLRAEVFGDSVAAATAGRALVAQHVTSLKRKIDELHQNNRGRVDGPWITGLLPATTPHIGQASGGLGLRYTVDNAFKEFNFTTSPHFFSGPEDYKRALEAVYAEMNRQRDELWSRTEELLVKPAELVSEKWMMLLASSPDNAPGHVPGE